MNGLGAIAFGVGLQDGLNPCIFMACAVFIIHRFWLASSSLRRTWFSILFVLFYALGILVFNFGPGQILISPKYFIVFAKVFYFVLGITAFVFGILFFRDWFLLSRRLPAEDLTDKRIRSLAPCGWVAFVISVALAVVLSCAATLWPINLYFLLLGNGAILRGQGNSAIPLLLGYVLTSMWPLWLVWAFLSIKKLRPSLSKIFCAAIFFTASTCMVFIFK